MFSFFKKKSSKKKGPQLHIDLHSHLIPGIDDGSRSIEESLALLQTLELLGYEKVITTPHIMSDYYNNDYEIIVNGRDLLRAAMKEEGIKLQIEVAAEYYLDEKFYDEMKKEKVLAINDTYVLFETSYISKPLQLKEMIFAITSAGYIPIMAHPERYRYIKEPEKEYTWIKELGVLFQINLNSLSGYYGKRAKVLSELLLEMGMIDFLGSDLHHKNQLDSLKDVFYLDVYHEVFRKNTIKNNQL